VTKGWVPWIKHLLTQQVGCLQMLHHRQLMMLLEVHLTVQLQLVTLVLQEDKLLVQIRWLICLLIQEWIKTCQSLRKTTKAVAP
jgi:hypothetical protein